MAAPPIARLHLVTPDLGPTGDVDALVAAVRQVAVPGSWVQVRLKDPVDRRRLERTDHLVATARAGGATVVVNDRIDVALATGADGVHLGAEDLPVAVARRLLGPGALIGATCRDADAACRAADAGADYVGVGPVFTTTTKAGLPPPIGLDGLAAVAVATDLPVIAISGITPSRVAAVVDAGAHGVAVVAAVFGADDPAGAAARFRAWLEPAAAAARP